MFYAILTSPQPSLTANLNREGILKLEVALARLFRCKFDAPDNVTIEILVRSLAAAGMPVVAAVVTPPLHGCSVHGCSGGPCGPLQRRPRGQVTVVNGFCLNWCAFQPL